jgi:hypothetical protein
MIDRAQMVSSAEHTLAGAALATDVSAAGARIDGRPRMMREG